MGISRKTSVLLLLLLPTIGRAQFIVDHQPYPAGGLASDTELPPAQLPWLWQQCADDFRVDVAATVTHVNWWGFHFENLAPPSETMRVQFYDSHAGDGLPGEILYEEVIVDPERLDTGRRIGLIGSPHEYRYHAALNTPISLSPGVMYWFEVVQVGDDASGFRHEFALQETNDFACRNNLFPEWHLTSLPGDLAFQLVIPEPMTVSMLLFGLTLAAGLRARGRLNSR